jgi:hypothetical protein
MRETRRRLFGLLWSAPLSVAASSAAAPEGRAEINGAPSVWIPLQADVTVTLNGGEVFKGSYHRSSNGSTRFEIGPDPIGGAQNVITIHNFTTENTYIRIPADQPNDWRVHPIKLHGIPWNPPRYRFNAHVREHPTLVKGRRVVKNTFASSDEHELLAPELNFLSLFARRTDHTEEYENIRVGQPRKDLFMPPTGVQLVHCDVSLVGYRKRKPAVQQ